MQQTVEHPRPTLRMEANLKAPPPDVEIDTPHWLWPSHEVTSDIDVPHWVINERGEKT